MSRFPAPPLCSLPRWRQALRFGRDPLGFLRDCFDSLGDVFSVRPMGSETWTFLCSPQAVRQMFRMPKDVLPAGDIHARFVGSLFGTDATFCLNGERHRRRQRLMMPLLSTKTGRAQVPMMRRLIETRATGWRQGDSVPLLSECHRMSLDILVHLIFGSEDPDYNRRLADSFERFSNIGARSMLVTLPSMQWDLGRLSPWGRILHLRDLTRHLVRERVELHRSRPRAVDDTSPLVDRVLSWDGESLENEAVVDELMNLLFAGHETTGTFLAWCLECIAGRPDVLRKVLDELDEGIGARPFEPEDVDRLPYLSAAIHETFRFRPVGPFSSFRAVAQDFELEAGDTTFHIRAGQALAYCFPIMARRADLFEDPDAFRPERFLDKAHGVHEWTPFGGGGRICTGRGLALVELQVALATLLRMVDFRLPDGEVRIARCGHLLAPADGLRTHVHPLRH